MMLGERASRTHVRFDVAALASRKWRREIHLGVASARDGTPTSRTVHAKRSGVSASTQYRAERDAGIVPEKNARIYDPDDPMAPNVDRPGVFVSPDRTPKLGVSCARNRLRPAAPWGAWGHVTPDKASDAPRRTIEIEIDTANGQNNAEATDRRPVAPAPMALQWTDRDEMEPLAAD